MREGRTTLVLGSLGERGGGGEVSASERRYCCYVVCLVLCLMGTCLLLLPGWRVARAEEAAQFELGNATRGDAR